MASTSTHDGPVTFAMRMDLVDRIVRALRILDDTLEAKQAQKEARLIETECQEESSSSIDYQQKGDARIQALLNQAADSSEVQKSASDDSCDSSLPKRTIGPYSEAVYHESGMFSTVYKARGPDGNIMALKVTYPNQMVAPHHSRREARILKKAASDHVVPMFSDLTLPSGEFVLTMKFLPMDLASILQSNIRHEGKATQTQLLSYLHDLFSGMAHLHSLGIIHRDIKPSNLLLASVSGPAYLADFGIAWMPGDRDSEAYGQMITDVGTTAYRPPELLFGNKRYSCALDLWSAGCVVAEVVNPRHQPLFDSGPLGSDLALIQSIFKTLGTPNDEIWPVSSDLVSNLSRNLVTIVGSENISRLGKNEIYGIRKSSLERCPR